MKNPTLLKSTILLSLFFLIGCSGLKTSTDTTKTTPSNTTETPQIGQKIFSIPYEKFTLDNGLEVILHVDDSDPIVAVATMLHVGSNREKPGRTGFAHFFEHMSFNDSENTPVGANRKLIPEWGGNRNGGTWSDGTIYYEVVPKDAFEKILWIDSDRLGYMIKTVTDNALEREKQVVKNEKRQRVDNQPYGYTDEVIRKNLYPSDHPYSWTTIGALPDLQAATIDDVKEFYDEFYGPNNATLVIAGDIDIAETKKQVKTWFGEIPKGKDVKSLPAMPAKLEKTKKLYFEDNFATLPELRMVFPTVENYHEDSYALNILGELLSGSRKSPLYKIIVDEKKLAPNVSTYQSSSELAGTFVFRVRTNEDVNLNAVKSAIEEGLTKFEQEGFDNSDLDRIKAQLETGLYRGISTILNKAWQLAQDNEFKGDPEFIVKRAAKTLAVTKEDIMRVYNKYIKGKHYLMTNFVPKEKMNLIVDGAEKATVWIEEVKKDVKNEEVTQGEEAQYEKTKTKHDRSEPDFGEPPLFKMPKVWKAGLPNGIKVLGIKNNELPLVSFDITINGGHMLDALDKPGVASLMMDMLMEGTANKTAIELEEAIGAQGASINTFSGNEEVRITGSCLARNFEKTLAIVEEILLEPRWDEDAFNRLKQELKTTLKGREARPGSVAFANFNKLVYGKDHIFSTSASGTLNTLDNITLDDLKAYYKKLSPKETHFHVVGAIDQARVTKALGSLNQKWTNSSNISIPKYELSKENHAGKIYFIDVPGSKQSTILMGKLTIPATHEDFNKIGFANEILGGGSSARLTQTLRIEKGYTYGASSFLRSAKETVPFVAYTSVRANATLPSLKIIEDMIGNYSTTFMQEDADITKNKKLKGNTRAFESLNAKLGILRNISKYGKSTSYVEDEQDELMSMSLEDFRGIIKKYIQEKEMVYVIVGDAETQLEEVNKLGKGKAILIDKYGNRVEK